MLQERKDQGGTRGFCHGDCNQHNMLRTAQGVRLVNYENLFYGEQMVDLANYLRKILEKTVGVRTWENIFWKPMKSREIVQGRKTAAACAASVSREILESIQSLQ